MTKIKREHGALSYGEKVIEDLQFYVRERTKEISNWSEVSQNDKRMWREKWVIDFLRAKGILESKGKEEDKS